MNKEILPLLHEFRIKDMACSTIFLSIWKRNLSSLLRDSSVNGLRITEKLPGENHFQACFEQLVEDNMDNSLLPKPPMNLNQVVVCILLPSLNITRQVMQQLISGNIRILDALTYLQECESLEIELRRMASFFEADITEDKIKKCVERLYCARDMKGCIEQSDAILKTADVLELKGDFESVKTIRDKVWIIYN